MSARAGASRMMRYASLLGAYLTDEGRLLEVVGLRDHALICRDARDDSMLEVPHADLGDYRRVYPGEAAE